MQTLSLERIVAAWAESREGPDSPESAEVKRIILQSIAAGKPISAVQLASASRKPLEPIEELFRRMKSSGADFDERGNLIGNVLTLRPTAHKFSVGGRELYAWCALDTLFLPGLIGRRADVESTCPATGEPIRLTISPEGIEESEPPGTVLSVVVPGVSAACAPDQKGGADGAVCSSMSFFISRAAASRWLGAQTDVAILGLEDAWRLAQEVWVEPFARALAGDA